MTALADIPALALTAAEAADLTLRTGDQPGGANRSVPGDTSPDGSGPRNGGGVA